MRHPRKRRQDQRGSVLVLVLIMLMLVGALIATMTDSMRSQAETAIQARELGQRLLDVDAALGRAKARLHADFTVNWASNPQSRTMIVNQEVTGWLTTPEGTTVDLACVADTATHKDFRLRATTALTRPSPRRIEMIVRVRYEFPTAPPMVVAGAGAIVAFGPIDVGGAFKVDGRDHPANATSFSQVLPGSGAPGISSTSTVTMSSGAVEIGGTSGSGTDYAPAKKGTAADGTHYDNSTNYWTNLGSQPNSADAYMGQSTGALKAAAQASNTYFTTREAYNTWVNTSGNSASGKVLYLEVANGATVGQVDLPLNPAPANDPAVVVIAGQNPTQHDTTVGPIHANNGTFQGVLIADRIMNMNGNGLLVGQVVTWTDSTLGPSVGNGTFDVLFSSEVLGNLPRLDDSTSTPINVVEDIQMWRETPPPQVTPP